MFSRRSAGSLTLALALAVTGTFAVPSLSFAQDPCTEAAQSGTPSEITNAGLEMPVPNTSNNWTHAAGSAFHTGRDQRALDLNENATSWDFDNRLPVLAAAAGTVRWAGASTCGYGTNVVVEHAHSSGTPFKTHYAHMHTALLVANGQTVSQGQVLGYISSTGSGANHLHFGVRRDTGVWFASVNGQSTANAGTTSLTLTSDTRMDWLEEFRRTDIWTQVTATGGPFAVNTSSGGSVRLPADSLLRAIDPIFVNPNTSPYRVSFATRGELINGSLVLSQVRIECLDSRTSTTPTRTVSLAPNFDYYGGGMVTSVPLTFGTASNQCPTTTKFVKPLLWVDGPTGGAGHFDWVRLEQQPLVNDGGQIQLNSYTRGGVRRHLWSAQATGSFTRIDLLSSTSATSTTRTQRCSWTPAGATSGFCETPNSTVTHRYYWWRFTRTDGVQRLVGPVGPVEPWTKATISGLGRSRVQTLDFVNIPLWASYPHATFDGVIDTYGIINYSPAKGTFTFRPDVPVVGLTRMEAYFGGNPTYVTVHAVDDITGATVLIGSGTSASLSWITISSGSWPSRTREVRVYFDRQNGDRYLHVDELRFR